MADAALLAVYPVRTAPGYWLVAVMLFVLAVAGGGAMGFVAMTATGDVAAWPFLVVLGVAALAPLGYWLATPAWRIGGGAGEIRFFADRLEVPAARGAGAAIVFPRDQLHAESREHRVRYAVAGMQAATVRRGHVIELRAGTQRRRLSTLTVPDRRAFLAELERFVPGTEEHLSTAPAHE